MTLFDTLKKHVQGLLSGKIPLFYCPLGTKTSTENLSFPQWIIL